VSRRFCVREDVGYFRIADDSGVNKLCWFSVKWRAVVPH